MVATFDYKSFAKDLTRQAEDIMPADIASDYKKVFLDRIYKYTLTAGEAFANDESIEQSETAKILTQIISEWTFHKYIDLLRSDIPEMYHENILQKLAYVAYEMAKESVLSNLTQDEMLHLVEFQLNKAYEKSCKMLLERKQISQAAYDKALRLSNVDDMSKHLCHNVKIIKQNSKSKILIFVMLVLALFTAGANIYLPESPNMAVLNVSMIVILSAFIGFYIGRNSK